MKQNVNANSSTARDKENMVSFADSIRTTRVVIETIAECYESTCEWSPVLINGSCSTEETGDTDESNVQQLAKPAAVSKCLQHLGVESCRELHREPQAGVAIDFQRPDQTDQASGDWATPETEGDGSSTAATRSVRTRMRNSSSGIAKRIKKEATEALHMLSTDVAMNDSDTNSEVSFRSRRNGKVDEIYPTNQWDDLDFDEGFEMCFGVVFDATIRSEETHEWPESQVFSFALTAEGKTSDVCTADWHFPGVAGYRDCDGSVEIRKCWRTYQQDRTGQMLDAILADEFSDSEEIVHELSITGSTDDEDECMEDRQDFIHFSATSKRDRQAGACSPESERIKFDAVGSREEEFTCSSTSSEDASFSLIIDSKAAADDDGTGETESLIKLGVSAEFNPVNNSQKSVERITHATKLETSSVPDSNQRMVFNDAIIAHNHDFDCTNDETMEIEALVDFASEVDSSGEFYVADYDDEASQDEPSASPVEVSAGNRTVHHEIQPDIQSELNMNTSGILRACHNADEYATLLDNDTSAEAVPVGLDYISSSCSSSSESGEVAEQEAGKAWTLWCRNRFDA